MLLHIWSLLKFSPPPWNSGRKNDCFKVEGSGCLVTPGICFPHLECDSCMFWSLEGYPEPLYNYAMYALDLSTPGVCTCGGVGAGLGSHKKQLFPWIKTSWRFLLKSKKRFLFLNTPSNVGGLFVKKLKRTIDLLEKWTEHHKKI